MRFGHARRAVPRIDRSDPARPLITLPGDVEAEARRVNEVFVHALAPGVVDVELDVRHLTHLGAEGASLFFRLARVAGARRPPVRILVTGAGPRTRADIQRLGLGLFVTHHPQA